MRRPNQSHPTFPILFHPQHIPRRAAFALALIIQRENLSRLPRLAAPVFDKLILILGPLTNPNGEVAAFFCLALETEGTTLGFESGDFALDVAIGAVLAFL